MSEMHTVSGESFSLHLDEEGHLTKIRFQERDIHLPVVCTLYELDGEPCDVVRLGEGKALSYKLTAGEASATLSIRSGKEVWFHLEPEQKDHVKQVGLNLFFPADAVFHLAEHRNIGRRLDSDMPVGESYRTKLTYNFFLVHVQGTWLRFRVNHRSFRMAEVEIARHPESFAATFFWSPDTDAAVAIFPSMADAVKDFQNWIETEFGARKSRERNLPAWVHDTRLIITADMLRSDWTITHDYRDVLNLARDLKKMGCPPDTLFYIPGWQGAYDSTHPTYRPRPELGGDAAFREMVNGIHECGYRVMIHTTGWGIDPYHPDMDKLDHLVLRDDEGDYRAWQASHKWLPPKRPLRFRTERIPLKAAKGSRSFSFETPNVPVWCEALVTVGGAGVGNGRIRLTLDRRSINSPPGWFAGHTEYNYPFPLLLQAGKNRIQVEVTGDGEPDWENAWYRIRYTFIPASPYSSWTWPILIADTSHPEYIKIFTENVSAVVREFGIDSVHVDATWFYHPDFRQARDLLLALRNTLPGIPICGEAVLAFEEMGFWTFAQACTQALVNSGVKRAPVEQGSVPVEAGLEDLFAWLNKESPVCAFAREYNYHYPHLCAANAFVPLGKVCNMFPPRQIPRDKDELWQILRDFRRLDYVPGIRLNYRRYGLDKETQKAIKELTQAGS
ncbi:MAG: hypothetical protein IT330_05150 [Anaerolineae bacterium]|nr:hypothetical protein [Anaerolineae bacterium]